MATFEDLFSATSLDIIAPEASVEYPPSQASTDDWLSRLQGREQAFLDEQLCAFATIRVDHISSTSLDKPPEDLLTFLAHLQITLETSYISAAPEPPRTLTSGLISTIPPGRRDSLQQQPSLRPQSLRPSIVPPSTPLPMPTAESKDQPYVRSEGVVLRNIIWGLTEDDALSLLWSDKEKVWVAVYKFVQTISYLRLPFNDPLLCLTASITLRDKPLLSRKNALTRTLDSYPSVLKLLASENDLANSRTDEDEIHGFTEVNLLEGLKAGTTFSSTALDLPSIRLGYASRNDMFSLQSAKNASAMATPISASTPTSKPSPASIPVMRKSHRRTLATVSGFRVRMRSVFVPSVLLSDMPDDNTLSREEREAAADERSVVLCVEVENSGDAGPRVGFQVDKIDVHISGDGASTTLVDWAEGEVFPLRVGAKQQYNLLYAVSFLRSPEELETLSTLPHENGSATAGSDLHRAVTITIHGKPYSYESLDPTTEVKFATGVFTSKWNVTLNLSSRRNQQSQTRDEDEGYHSNVLPEPASPFPFSVTSGSQSNNAAPSPMPRIGLGLRGLGLDKRHTIPSTEKQGPFNRNSLPPPLPPMSGNYPRPPYQRERTNSSSSLRPSSLAPPSIALPPKTSNTYDMPSMGGPNTPAYPAFPSGSPQQLGPPTPVQFQDPQAFVGPSIDVRRQKAMSFNVPPTPGPVLSFGQTGDSVASPGMFERQQQVETTPDIAVSVGLILRDEDVLEEYVNPMDDFWLDILVFNKSGEVRRFEVSCSDGQRKRGAEDWEPGVVPMENGIRIGPLLPNACQSVRMRFKALKPGIHSVNTLTLTDRGTGKYVNLGSVMDVVVREPEIMTSIEL